jgi:hypothetical protein
MKVVFAAIEVVNKSSSCMFVAYWFWLWTVSIVRAESGLRAFRCGTSSTYVALNFLGFKCYHMRELLREHPEHLEFWQVIAKSQKGSQSQEAEPIDLDLIFDKYEATVDWPGAC